MHRHMTLSMIVTCTLALPLATTALASGSHNSGASPNQTGKLRDDTPAIPKYIQPGSPITASKILGTTVMSSDGKDIGDVNNMVMNRHGQITHLIIDTENTIRGGDLIAIPWQLVNPTNKYVMNPGDRSLHIIVTKDVVDGAPTIKRHNFPLPHSDSSLKLSNHNFRSYFESRNS